MSNGDLLGILQNLLTAEGIPVVRLQGTMDRPLSEVCGILRPWLSDLRAFPRPLAILWGGEPTLAVTPPSPGLGGRMQHLALSLVEAIAQAPHLSLLAWATDGSDGPTSAAGTLVDGSTLAKAKSLGLKCQAALDSFESFAFHQKLQTLWITGPTGLNVCDILFLLSLPTPL